MRLLTAVCFVITSCAQTDDPQHAPLQITARDSAAVEIIEFELDTNRKPAGRAVIADTAWLTFSTGPVSRVSGGAFLGDNFLVVAHSRHQVTAFSADGGELFTVGREGKGPGEYRNISAVSVIADDSIALLHDQSMLTVLARDGSFARRQVLPLIFNSTVRENGVAAAGNVFLLNFAMPIREMSLGNPGLANGTSSLIHVSPTDNAADTIRILPGTTWNILRRGSVTEAPFAATAFLAVGSRSAAAGWSGGGSVYEFDANGLLQRIVRISSNAEPIEDEDVESWCSGHSPDAADCRTVRLEGGARAEREFPAEKPLFSSILLSNGGELWIQQFHDPEIASEQTWYVLSPDRSEVRRISIPPRVRILAVNRELVLAVHVDSLDVERVALLTMRN